MLMSLVFAQIRNFTCVLVPIAAWDGGVVQADHPPSRPMHTGVSADPVGDAVGGTLPGDADGDGDVDLFDFEQFAACSTGPGGDIDPPCDVFDFDADLDVDFADFAQLQPLIEGGTSPCACNGDVNGSGDISPFDWLALRQCIASDCYEERFDITCDGAVDWCDMDTLDCLGTGDATCCETVICGACILNSACSTMTEQSCVDAGGIYMGDGAPCLDP